MKGKKITETPRQAKPLTLTEMTVQDYTHMSTADVVRWRAALQFEAKELESQLTELASRIADARARLSTINAQMAGLAVVIEKRS